VLELTCIDDFCCWFEGQGTMALVSLMGPGHMPVKTAAKLITFRYNGDQKEEGQKHVQKNPDRGEQGCL
jgi:hypothetical protein